MADTAAVVRLMLHAADRLEQEDPLKILPTNYRQYSDGLDCYRRATSASVAVTYAAVMLRMVAAFMVDEPADAAVCDDMMTTGLLGDEINHFCERPQGHTGWHEEGDMRWRDNAPKDTS